MIFLKYFLKKLKMRNIRQDFYNLTNYLNMNMIQEFEYYLQKLLTYTTGRHDINDIYKVEDEVEINNKGEVVNIPPLILNTILQKKFNFLQILMKYGHPKNLKFDIYTDKCILHFFIDKLSDGEAEKISTLFTPNEIQFAVEIFDDNPKKYILCRKNSYNVDAITYAYNNHKTKIASILKNFI